MITSDFVWKHLFYFIEDNNLFGRVNYDVYDDINEVYSNGKVEPLKGFYDIETNTVVIIASQHKTLEDLQKTFQHETFGHFGINHFSPSQKKELLNSIKNEFDNPNCSFKKELDFLNSSDDYKDKLLIHKAKEIFAFIAQDIKINLDHKFTPFEQKLDGSTKDKIENIVQNLAAGIRENKLIIQKDNFVTKSQNIGVSR